MGSDLYFFHQVETRKVPKRYRKLPEELPESLRFAHLNPKVAALLASKERSQRPDNEDPFGDGLGKKSLLPDINAAFTNVRNQFDSALSNDEDSQRFLFEEAKVSASTILEQLGRIIYFYEDLHNHVPKSLEYQLMSGWGELTNDITIVPREWQTQEMKEQFAAKQQQEVNSEEEISDNDMLTGRTKSRMGASDRTSSELGGKVNMKKSKPKLGVIEAMEEGDGLLKPDSRLGRRSDSRASATGSILKHQLDLSNISRMGNRRKGSSMSSHRSTTALANPMSYMQTINFQLSNKSFEEKGWIMLKGRQEEIDQNEILEYCVTRLQESMKQIAAQKQKDAEQGHDKPVMVRYYGDTKKETLLKYRKSPVKSTPSPIYKGGKPRIPSIVDERNEGKKLMQASHQDGSTIVYYPSGRPAVIHSAAGFGRPGFYTVVYEDGLDSKMLACFTPSGRGVCYYDNGIVRFLATERGGHLAEVNGKLVRKWKWPQACVKITEPLSFQVSSNVMFRCVSQSHMTVVFSCQKEMARFTVGPASDAEDFKFIEESDQLLTTFTFSSKAAKDLMRIFAPTRKNKRKGRKDEETDEEDKVALDNIRPRFDLSLARRVRRMSLMPTVVLKAPVVARAAMSMTGCLKRLTNMGESLRESDNEDEEYTNERKDDDVKKRQAISPEFVKGCMKGKRKGLDKENEKKAESVKVVVEEATKDDEASPKKEASKVKVVIPDGRTSSSKLPRKASDEGSEKRAKSAKVHTVKSPRSSNPSLSARKSRTLSPRSSHEEVFDRLSTPKQRYCSHKDRHHSETAVASQKHGGLNSFSEAKVSRQMSDFHTPSRKHSETKESPRSLKSIMKKPVIDKPQSDTKHVCKSHSARLKPKSVDSSDDSVKRAHSASGYYQRSPRQHDDRLASSVLTSTQGHDIEQSDQIASNLTPGPSIKISKSFEIPAIIVEESLTPGEKDSDTHRSVSYRSVLKHNTESSQSVSHRVAFQTSSTCSTKNVESDLALGQTASNLSNQISAKTSSHVSQGEDQSESRGSGLSVRSEDSENFTPPVVKKTRRSSIMKSILQFRKKVLAKKGIVLSDDESSEEEEKTDDEEGPSASTDPEVHTSKSQASEILKLMDDFPDKVTYEIEADKELAKLQRKAKNVVDDWMEHYRIAIGFASPYLQNVREVPNYSIANRHAKSARPSDHQQMIRKAVLGMDDDLSPRRARILSAPLGNLKDDDDDDAKTIATDPRAPTAVTFGDHDEGAGDGTMSPTAMAVINRLTETASRRSTRSKVSSARSGSPSRQHAQTDRAPSAAGGSRSHCPLVIRQFKLGYERPQCRCSRHHIPFIMDLELDEFIATEATESQLIVIMIVSSLFPGITKAEEMLNEIYNNQNRNRTRPCVQSRSDMFRVFKYDINSAAEMSDHTQPLLLTRHSVVPGMFLIYCDGKLLFCDHIFNGYGNTRKDFKKQVMKSRHDAIHGFSLPKDFKFSPSKGRSGMRSAWGGEIGGAGVDKYSSSGTVIDMALQPIHRPSSSSSGQSKEIHLDAVRSTSRRPFLPHIDTSQTGTSSDTYQYESVHDWVSTSLPGIQSTSISNSTSFATSLSETTY